MSFISKLNTSEKKQMLVLSIALALVMAFIVYVFISIADSQQITIDEARTTAPRADKIDKLAIELTRLEGFTTFEGQKVTQYELQNPTDGGAGDDGTFDDARDVIQSSVEDVRRINESVALANGTTVEARPTRKTLKQINQEQRDAEQAAAEARKEQAAANLSDVKVSVVE